MPRTGFIDHIGIGVPDLVAAKRYYDEFMPILGLRAWFPTTDAGEFNYGPDGARGSQIFFYQALEPGRHSRHGTGLQHLSFMVSSRATVREAHDWAVAHNAEVVHEPRGFPEYGEHYATYFLDPCGFMLEVVCQPSRGQSLRRSRWLSCHHTRTTWPMMLVPLIGPQYRLSHEYARLSPSM